MGNYISCTNISAPRMTKTAKVILPSGEIRHFLDVVTAAELMVEFPNFFLVNASSLTIGRRFQPLAADEDLQLGNIYAMYPMKRTRSRVTAADMTILLMASGNSSQRRRRIISIGGGGECDGPDGGNYNGMMIISGRRLSLDGGVDAFRMMESGEEEEEEISGQRRRLSLDGDGFPVVLEKVKCCRSRGPMLDTIMEEEPPISSSHTKLPSKNYSLFLSNSHYIF